MAGAEYNASKEMFILSNPGYPNYITNENGYYTFNYKNAFVGDSVPVRFNEISPGYKIILNSNITLLFKRNGYYPVYKNISLSPDTLVNMNITMTRE